MFRSGLVVNWSIVGIAAHQNGFDVPKILKFRNKKVHGAWRVSIGKAIDLFFWRHGAFSDIV